MDVPRQHAHPSAKHSGSPPVPEQKSFSSSDPHHIHPQPLMWLSRLRRPVRFRKPFEPKTEARSHDPGAFHPIEKWDRTPPRILTPPQANLRGQTPRPPNNSNSLNKGNKTKENLIFIVKNQAKNSSNSNNPFQTKTQQKKIILAPERSNLR